jgi:subtilase family serine protease
MSESAETKKSTEEGKAPNSSNTITLVLLVVIVILVGLLFTPKILAPFQKPEEEEVSVEREEVMVEEVLPAEDANVAPDVVVDTSAGTEEFVKPLADLYITDYSYGSDLMQNDQFTMELTFSNKGNADAGEFSWEWGATEGGQTCGSDISELVVGETVTVQCDHAYSGSGSFDSWVLVDTGDDVEESNENNNDLIEEINIAPRADLYISEYSFDPVPEKAIPFTVRIGLTNQGDEETGEFYWEWWPTAYDYACREKITNIAPNSEKVVTCDYTYGGWSTYPTKAVADADDTVDEFDESNNEYVETVVPIH